MMEYSTESIIDTLKIRAQDWELSTAKHFTVQKTNNTAKNILYDQNGIQFCGTRAYNNEGICNTTIVRNSKQPVSHLLVQFSVPKALSESHNLGTDSQDLQEAIEKVNTHLNAIGVNTNLHEGIVSRLDVCRNIITELPYYAYKPVFDQFRPTRHLTEKTTEDSYLWENGSREISIYDKVNQLKEVQKIDVSGLPFIARFEDRRLKPESVETRYGIKYVSDLYSNPEHYKLAYKRAMKKDLFRIDITGNSIGNINDLNETIENFQREYGNSWQREFQSAMLAHFLDEKYGLDTYTECYAKAMQAYGETSGAKAGTIRTRKNRFLDRAKEYHLEAGLITNNGNEHTAIELYNELKSKVLN